MLERFLDLKHECTRDGEEYIVSLVGGDCRDDFEFYLGPPFASTFDQAHDDFKTYAIPLLSLDDDGGTNGAMVLDIEFAQS